MPLKRLLGLMLALSCSSAANREVCGNGVDDDGNGQTDCADVDCAGQMGCPPYDGGYYGGCAHCGSSCNRQSACVNDYTRDLPTPQCQAGTCQALNQAIHVDVQLDMSAYNGLYNLLAGGTVATRFILKTALDGSAVTCAAVTAVAPIDGGVLQIESSGRFNLLGLDVSPIGTVMPTVEQPLVNVGTGASYLVWLELWSGPRDPTNHLPTGRRYQPLCEETSAELTPLTAADDCDRDAGGSCKTFHFRVPAPM